MAKARKRKQSEPPPAGPGRPSAADELHARFGVGNVERVFGLCEQVLEKRWSVSQVRVPYRWISYWDRARILMDVGREGAGWRKFSFIDYVWIHMVCEMRAFGISFGAIRRVKEALAAPLPVEPRLMLRKTRQRSAYNVLLLLVAEAVVTRAAINLLVRSDGEFLLHNESQAGAYGPELAAFRSCPHLCVPLTGMLGEMIRRNDIHFIVPRIPLLSPAEAETLALLREGRLTRLEVAVGPGNPVLVIERTGYDCAAAEGMLLERLMLNPYQEIRYETDDGKRVSFRAAPGGHGGAQTFHPELT